MPEKSPNYGTVLQELGYEIQGDCKIDCIKVLIQGEGARGFFEKAYFGIKNMNDTPEAVEATFEDFLEANRKTIKLTEVNPTGKENRMEVVFYAENNAKTLRELYQSLIAINDTHKRGIPKASIGEKLSA